MVNPETPSLHSSFFWCLGILCGILDVLNVSWKDFLCLVFGLKTGKEVSVSAGYAVLSVLHHAVICFSASSLFSRGSRTASSPMKVEFGINALVFSMAWRRLVPPKKSATFFPDRSFLFA